MEYGSKGVQGYNSKENVWTSISKEVKSSKDDCKKGGRHSGIGLLEN